MSFFGKGGHGAEAYPHNPLKYYFCHHHQLGFLV